MLSLSRIGAALALSALISSCSGEARPQSAGTSGAGGGGGQATNGGNSGAAGSNATGGATSGGSATSGGAMSGGAGASAGTVSNGGSTMSGGASGTAGMTSTSGGGAGMTAAGGSAGSGGKAGQGGSAMGGSGGSATEQRTLVYVATGDWGKDGQGKISVYGMDAATLALTPLSDVAAGTLPSYITFDAQGRTLFAGDESEGVVRAFSVDPTSGKLTLLNTANASGHPVYLSVDAAGKFLLAAHYNEGSTEVFAIKTDHSVGASVKTLSSGTQSHSVVLAPGERFAFVQNRGSNDIRQYTFNAMTGALSANTPPSIAASGGPRALVFHPTKPYAYVMNELGSTLRAYSFDASTGLLKEIDNQDTRPPGFSGDTAGADVRIDASGHFVYGSNRAGSASTLAIFAIDEADGTLTLVGHESTHGDTPRNFATHPTREVLFVANQDSKNVASFRLNAATGTPEFVATTTVPDKAWCVRFLLLP